MKVFGVFFSPIILTGISFLGCQEGKKNYRSSWERTKIVEEVDSEPEIDPINDAMDIVGEVYRLDEKRLALQESAEQKTYVLEFDPLLNIESGKKYKIHGMKLENDGSDLPIIVVEDAEEIRDETYLEVTGTLVTMSRSGAESTGYGLRLANDSVIELDLATHDVGAEFEDNSDAVVLGYYKQVRGIETPVRVVFEVKEIRKVQ